MDALSQKDIDSLLKGSALPEVPAAPVEIVPYNFLRPPRISRDRRATIEGIYSRFAVSLQSLLSSRLRVPCDVVVTSVEQATFGEYILALGNPCAAFVFDLAGGGQGAMDVGTDLSFFLVDRMFGGPGEGSAAGRALTPLERLAVKGIADRALGFLAEAWQDHLALDPVPAGFESLPEALQVASKEDNVLVANLEVRASAFSGLLTICIPLLALEAFLQEKPAAVRQVGRASPSERAADRAAIEQSVRIATLPVVARFPSFQLRTRDLAGLRAGQVIQTGLAMDAPLEVRVNGRLRFHGTPGQVRRAMGVCISEVLPPGIPETISRSRRARVV